MQDHILFSVEIGTQNLLIFFCEPAQTPDIFALKTAFGKRGVDEVAEGGAVGFLQGEIQILTEMVEKGADLRVVNDADQRDALPGGSMLTKQCTQSAKSTCAHLWAFLMQNSFTSFTRPV